MKIGDRFIVYIEGLAVCEAHVEWIEDGKATLLLPETRAVFGINSSLTDVAPEVDRQLSNEVDRPETNRTADHAPGTVAPEPVSLQDMELDSSILDDEEPKK